MTIYLIIQPAAVEAILPQIQFLSFFFFFFFSFIIL